MQHTVGHDEYSGGFHEYTGECSVRWGYHEYTRGYHVKCGRRSFRKQLNLYILNIPRCTHDICHTRHGIPSVLVVTPSVLNSTAVLIISPTLIMVSPTVLNTPGVLMISPSVLNTHGCTQ